MLRRSESRGVSVAPLFGEELLDGGEDDAARFDRELAAQVRPAVRLHRRLAKQVPAAREGAEELIVEIVAVGQHHHGRVGHRRLADDASGIEGHGEALAGALGVPDDADAPVARISTRLGAGLVAPGLLADLGCALQLGRAQRLADRCLDGVELVVPRHLLRESAAAVVLEHDEVAQEGEKAPLLERSLDCHLEFGEEHRGQLLAGDGAPGLEPFPPRGEGAEPGLDAVGYCEHRVEGEQRGQLRLVCPELPPGTSEGRVLVRRVLELDDGERQAVDEQHDVGAALVAALHHGELVDGEPVVVRRLLEVEHLHLRASNRAAVVAVLHCDSVHRQPVEGAVAGFQGRSFGVRQLAEGVIQRLGGQVRVQAVEGAAHD